MTFSHAIKTLFLALMLVAIPGTRLFGLLSFNDGKDRVFVSATYSITYDSNIFDSGSAVPDQTNPGSSKNDFIQSSTLGIDYTRRAGLIGVNAGLSWSFGSFSKHNTENFANPSATLKLTKGTGRITGALSIQVRRQSSSDAAANVRSTSWFYGAGLDGKYPIDNRFYLTAQTDFSLNRYVSSTILSNLTTWREAAGLYYVYSSKLSLFFDYRITDSQTSETLSSLDNAYAFGITGGLLPKLSGSMTFGYQRRTAYTKASFDTDGTELLPATTDHFGALFASVGLAYTMTKKMAFDLSASEDFSTTATAVSIDSRSASLHGNYAFNRRLNVNGGVTYANTKFLGSAGRGRKDQTLIFDASVSYAITSHFKFNATYSEMYNYSNTAFADFAKRVIGATISARY